MFRFLLQARLLLQAFVLVGIGVCSTQGNGQTLHAIVIADLSPAAQWGKYGPAIQTDAAMMFYQLYSHVPESRLAYYSLQMLENEDSSPSTIRNMLSEIQPQANDTLLVYYTGHGGHDDQGHYFSLANGNLHRRELKEIMEQKGARLNVLLTDSCDLRDDGQDFFSPAMMPEEPQQITPLFESLFFQPRGWVDINSCAPNEASFVAQPREDEFAGSLFTTALCDFWKRRAQRTASWDQLVREVSIGVTVAFAAEYPKGATLPKGGDPQTSQTVHPMLYPDMPLREGPRSGLTVRDHSGPGVLIAEVVPGQPGQQVFDVQAKVYGALRAGHVITSANGTAITTAKQFAALVQQSPQIMRLTILSGNRRGEVLLRLRY